MYTERIKKFREKLKAQDLEGFLVAKPQNCFYLSGFTGSNCSLLITEERLLLFTDFRYLTQAGMETDNFEVILWQEPLWVNLALKIKEVGIKSLGFEAHFFTFKDYQSLSQQLKTLELRPLANIVEELRKVKNEEEIGKIRQAATLADLALAHVLEEIKPGKAEFDIALELDYQMRRQGADGAAFDVIVASGERSALPHAKPSKKVLLAGDLVLVDIGAKFQGYSSDMTRVFALSRPNNEQERLFRTVYEAQKVALETVKAGIESEIIDATAREIIARQGWSQFFGHGTGHGLGLEVHEAPVIAPGSKDVILPGMVFTIEPGVYLPHLGGVRIEDSVFLGENGIEVLSRFSKELIVL